MLNAYDEEIKQRVSTNEISIQVEFDPLKTNPISECQDKRKKANKFHYLSSSKESCLLKYRITKSKNKSFFDKISENEMSPAALEKKIELKTKSKSTEQKDFSKILKKFQSVCLNNQEDFHQKGKIEHNRNFSDIKYSNFSKIKPIKEYAERCYQIPPVFDPSSNFFSRKRVGSNKRIQKTLKNSYFNSIEKMTFSRLLTPQSRFTSKKLQRNQLVK